jgi:lipopolysaccharide transport system permease protein
MLVTQAPPALSVLWLPVVLMPVILLTSGLGWLLASLGVFVRDIGHVVALITQVLFFATPVFYRVERVPESFRWLMYANPLTPVVESARRVMLGETYLRWVGSVSTTQPASAPEALRAAWVAPDWPGWGLSLAVGAVCALLGYAFFMKSKRAFGDVI